MHADRERKFRCPAEGALNSPDLLSPSTAKVDEVVCTQNLGWLHLEPTGGGILVSINGPVKVSTIELGWKMFLPQGSAVLGDAWERGYGDLGWKPLVEMHSSPWYTVVWFEGAGIAFGAKTTPNCLVCWTVAPDGVVAELDVRSGTRPLCLGARTLAAAELIVLRSAPDETPYEFLNRFCSALCSDPRLPESPVYGANDWYYAYGNNSGERILQDSDRASQWAIDHQNRPFSVIDAGWQQNGGCEGGPWIGNARYGDMGQLARAIGDTGCRPGIWIRPLLTQEAVPAHWLMREQTLDPSQPDALEKALEGVRQCAEWGYELIKHDFTTWDCTHLWGFEMGKVRHSTGGTFADDTRTTAEILLDLYRGIREAAGSALLLGCNTIGHLAAGTHEIQRTGDDTSGKEWSRTLKMGVNTLAFRSPQHGRFFAADADCVGITQEIPWEFNRQWLDAVGRSGTPLFVSADSNGLTEQIERAISEAFGLAARQQPVAEALDWLHTPTPREWRQGSHTTTYDWRA